MSESNKPTERRRLLSLKNTVITAVLLMIIIVLAALAVRYTYDQNLKPLNSSQENIIVTVESGSVPSKIADNLKSEGIIKSDWALEWYVRNHNLRDKLKAGTYVFQPSMSIPEIADILVTGKVASDLVTILPGKTINQIKAAFVNAGFSEQEIKSALEPDQYKNHPALTDKPAGQSLEGYLYPESFQKTSNTRLKQIIKLSLDEMQSYLTPELRKAFSNQGLNTHQAVTIASIIEQEVANKSDRRLVAQVFLKRYKENIPLGADPTAFYGAIKDGAEPSVFHDSPYNTRKYAGLPPGPIGNASVSSLKAVAFPANTDWLYFVAGDDGTTYFSKTLEEHEALTEKYCTKLCNQ